LIVLFLRKRFSYINNKKQKKTPLSLQNTKYYDVTMATNDNRQDNTFKNLLPSYVLYNMISLSFDNLILPIPPPYSYQILVNSFFYFLALLVYKSLRRYFYTTLVVLIFLCFWGWNTEKKTIVGLELFVLVGITCIWLNQLNVSIIYYYYRSYNLNYVI